MRVIASSIEFQFNETLPIQVVRDGELSALSATEVVGVFYLVFQVQARSSRFARFVDTYMP